MMVAQQVGSSPARDRTGHGCAFLHKKGAATWRQDTAKLRNISQTIRFLCRFASWRRRDGRSRHLRNYRYNPYFTPRAAAAASDRAVAFRDAPSTAQTRHGFRLSLRALSDQLAHHLSNLPPSMVGSTARPCIRFFCAHIVHARSCERAPTDVFPPPWAPPPAQPMFCDITWGAGGSTADLTLDIASKMQNQVCAR